jgi:alpha-methylacyl-CoA racemase
LPPQLDTDGWPELSERLTRVFATRDRDAWAKIFEAADACVTPVLSPFEAHRHPHNAACATFTEVAGARQPAPAPHFSHTPGAIAAPSPRPGEHTDSALADWGLTTAELTALRKDGAVA